MCSLHIKQCPVTDFSPVMSNPNIEPEQAFFWSVVLKFLQLAAEPWPIFPVLFKTTTQRPLLPAICLTFMPLRSPAAASMARD
jgi:hypothetical protein